VLRIGRPPDAAPLTCCGDIRDSAYLLYVLLLFAPVRSSPVFFSRTPGLFGKGRRRIFEKRRSDFIPADVVENRTDFGIFERAPQRGINYAAYPATCSAMRAQRNLGFHLSAARRSEALDFRAATKRNLATKPSTWPVIFANRLILDRLDGDRAQKFLKDFIAGLKREGLAGESCATRSPRCFTLDSS